MNISDPIADMLTRIRNAGLTGKPEVLVPHSKLKIKLAHILLDEGYIQSVEELTDQPKMLKIGLKYNEHKKAYIRGLKRVSKPGLRVYAGKSHLPIVLNGLGIAVVSTSKGLMTVTQAKKHALGGEVICEIY